MGLLRKPLLHTNNMNVTRREEGGSSVAVLLVSHHRLELTQAAVGCFHSVVIWQVTDKSKYSGSHGIVHAREISWEPSADSPSPPTHAHIYNPCKHRQSCLLLLSIHFFLCLIVRLCNHCSGCEVLF